jgi:REP element-mobilizing transposase RayT
MNAENHLPRRLRRLTNVYLPNPVYFLTLCTEDRERSLASDFVHSAFVKFMRGSPQRYGWSCGEYVLMPDHAHFFAVPFPNGVTLGSWVKAIKAFVRLAGTEHRIHWQKGFFDHVLRSAESYSEKWVYVRQNPVRAGLVAEADDWPFLGQIDVMTM